jgi:hypothetical protein
MPSAQGGQNVSVFIIAIIGVFAITFTDNARANEGPIDITVKSRMVEHGGGCCKSSPPGQCCHMDNSTGSVHCH